MADELEIAGFRVSLEGEEAVCRFALSEDLGVDPPPNLEENFRSELQPGGRLQGKRLVVSLDTMLAMSSRQLGSLLSIHRATGTGGKLAVRGVRRNVRELFEMTRMDQFFDY
jgi:anti-anti-sigma factor